MIKIHPSHIRYKYLTSFWICETAKITVNLIKLVSYLDRPPL